jgi:serine phosphatase RsbU (regulator of sigma subunit)
MNEDGVKSKQDSIFSFEIAPPFWKTKWFIFLVLFSISVSIYLFIFFRTLNLRRAKEKLEIQVKERTNEIELKNFTLQKANLIISNKNKEITDSINYAKKIQEAILPSKNIIKELFPESFILFKPKDIVSGDFYWFTHLSNQNPLLAGLTGATENPRLMQKNEIGKDVVVVAVADCTGHGVPGAFMCMIGTSLLNQVVQENIDGLPSSILTMLNSGIQTALKQTQSETQDGMDIALCSIDRKNKSISFSGAMRPLHIFRKKIVDGKQTVEFEEMKPDKNPIGGIHGRDDKHFTQQNTTYQIGDTIYLFSDGFADQFGGENGKKLMTKKFRELVSGIQHLTMEEQYFYLENFMEKWKNGYDQVDDILIMGIRF